MSAWDDGHAAGKEWRTKGIDFTLLDIVDLHNRAAAATTNPDAASEWLFGFYKGALEEISDEAVTALTERGS
jgi:hypothetical protein